MLLYIYECAQSCFFGCWVALIFIVCGYVLSFDEFDSSLVWYLKWEIVSICYTARVCGEFYGGLVCYFKWDIPSICYTARIWGMEFDPLGKITKTKRKN